MIDDTGEEKKKLLGKSITVPIILTTELDALHIHNKIVLYKLKCAQLLYTLSFYMRLQI